MINKNSQASGLKTKTITLLHNEIKLPVRIHIHTVQKHAQSISTNSDPSRRCCDQWVVMLKWKILNIDNVAQSKKKKKSMPSHGYTDSLSVVNWVPLACGCKGNHSKRWCNSLKLLVLEKGVRGKAAVIQKPVSILNGPRNKKNKKQKKKIF